MSLLRFLNIQFVSLVLLSGEVFSQVQTPPGTLPPAPTFGEIIGKMSPMLVMVFFIFYFMVVRPQNKKLEEQQQLLNDLKKGDNVITTSGVHARVFSVETDHIVLEPSAGIKIKFEKSSIQKKI